MNDAQHADYWNNVINSLPVQDLFAVQYCNQHPSSGPDSFAATNSLMIVDWRLLALPVVSVHRYLSILCSHAQGMCMGYLGNCAISFLTDIDSLFSGF